MDESVEARGGERIRLALWLVFAGVLPLWAILTATIAQMEPRESIPTVIVVEDGLTDIGYLDQGPSWWRAGRAGLIAGAWIGVAGAALLPMVGALALWRGRRPDVPTGGELLDDALVAGAALEVRVRRDDAVAPAPRAAPVDAAAPAAVPREPEPAPAAPEVEPPPAGSADEPPGDGADELHDLFR